MSVSASVSISASGVVIPGVPGFSIAVIAASIVATGATNLKLMSGVVDLTGAFPLAANCGFVLPPASIQYPWVKTAIGDDLIVNLSAGTPVGGVIIYDLI
jgi:hypothetical protein